MCEGTVESAVGGRVVSIDLVVSFNSPPAARSFFFVAINAPYARWWKGGRYLALALRTVCVFGGGISLFRQDQVGEEKR